MAHCSIDKITKDQCGFVTIFLTTVRNPLYSIDVLANPPEVLSLIERLSDEDFRSVRRQRLEEVQRRLDESSLDCLILSIGADMPWLCGYQAMPLERLTTLVIPRGERPTLVVPRLEAPRVRHDLELFDLKSWNEDENPYSITSDLSGSSQNIGVSDRMWASALLGLQDLMPDMKFASSSSIIAPLRQQKDDLELLLLSRAAHITDEVALEILTGAIEFEGRTERGVSEQISNSLLAKGLVKVNFAIVGSGENSASPHHEPGERRIKSKDPVVCDFGGVYSVMDEPGYCSDITRTVSVGAVDTEFSELYSVLLDAQDIARRNANSTMTGRAIDDLARDEIVRFGWGEFFIHRTGHGIGMEEHEEPYISSVNDTPVGSYATFSIEPGIYVPGKFGARIEDICVTGEHGMLSLNAAPRDLHIV